MCPGATTWLYPLSLLEVTETSLNQKWHTIRIEMKKHCEVECIIDS